MSYIVLRKGIRYVLAFRLFADFLGSGYRYMRREDGKILRFWSKRDAQEVADRLNGDKP